MTAAAYVRFRPDGPRAEGEPPHAPITVRVTEAEKTAIEAAASAAGLSVSEWLRVILRDLSARADRFGLPAAVLARLLAVSAAGVSDLGAELDGARTVHLGRVAAARARAGS